MPLYEYECEKCAHRFERIQKFSDPPVDLCPSCGGAVRKLLSSPAIQFKGAGWYITDYARKGSGGDSAKGETSTGDSTTPGSSKPESAKTESGSGPASKTSDTKTA